MKTVSTIAKTLIAIATVGALTAASATPIIGYTGITAGAVKVTLGNIDWNNNPLNINPPPNAVKTFGQFGVNVAPDGSFTGMAGSVGMVQDMSENVADANHFATGNGFTANFLTFATQPNWKFDLTRVEPGNVLGNPNAPYFLTFAGGSTSASIFMSGKACDMATTGLATVCDAGDDVTNWTGTFTANFPGYNQAQLIAAVVAGTLPIRSWSADIVASAVVPEPASLALVGLALVGLGFVGNRRKQA
jgi:hypothetical protein